ncbi:MAG: class I mannose-6-phosphate isomerase [Bacteroidaceae bacterium]|nr:class I mannose-6-phosphate isomerase [Bacteroidaceae bacterium]MBQ2969664.1 class I mannose-6-phosphate isomerase [Bacteroidaceae bacterium]
MKILRFQPIMKQTLWGGKRIATFKQFDCTNSNIGESWELSGVAGNETTCVTMGGKSLNTLVAEYKDRLVGKANYERFGNEFPLLIKFIDAHQDLSIQVHPDDATALRQGKTRGKTEMWYLMHSDAGAKLYSGLKQQITPEQYKTMVEDGSICDALAQYSVKEDDVFFLPAGRIHSIGSGCFLVEIQQTSDVTYRIYDFKRKDKDGNYRQLHTDEAAEAIDFTIYDDYRTLYTPCKNRAVELVNCPYFTTNVYDINRPTPIETAKHDTFIILIVVKGEGTITTDEGEMTQVATGDTLLIAAENKHLVADGNIKLLETHINQ